MKARQMAPEQKKTKHIPERMCVVCRRRGDKGDLLRLVRVDGRATFDPTGRMNGRGAYICRDEECISKAKKKHSINAALKAEVTEDLWTSIESCCH